MKIETQSMESHQVKLTVEVEPAMLEEARRHAAREISRHAKIPGFRPGKAPFNVVLRQYGEEAIFEEAVEHLVQDLYPKVIEEAGIQPYGPGSLEGIPSKDPLTLAFLIPLQPEVVLGDYHSLSFPYEPPSVSESQVDEVLEDLQNRQAVLEPVERPAQEGDMVTVLINAVRLNVEEDRDPTLIRERSAPILVKPEAPEEPEAEAEGEEKAQSAVEWPFRGFSRYLVGMSVDDEQTITYTYPENGEYSALSGTQAEFTIKVQEVKNRTLPEMNDDFASSLGDYASLDALRGEIRSNLEKEAESGYNETYDEQFLEEAVTRSEFKYPQQMLEQEIDNSIDGLENRLKRSGIDMEVYLKSRNLDKDGLREEIRPNAEKRLKRTLLLLEVAQKEDINVHPEELQAEVNETMNALRYSLPRAEADRLSDKRVYSRLVGNVMEDMLLSKATKHLRNIASGRVEETSVEETAVVEASPSAELADQVENLPTEEHPELMTAGETQSVPPVPENATQSPD